MTVSIWEAPGLAVTQQMAMEADIIIRTVFRIAASVQPEHVHMQEYIGCVTENGANTKFRPFIVEVQYWLNLGSLFD